MRIPNFNDRTTHFIAICFVQEIDLKDFQNELEKVGARSNVSLAVQPCPYEGIEFLHRYDDELFFQQVDADEKVLWKVLAVKAETPKPVVDQLAEAYYAYLCAILVQDEKAVKQALVSINQNQIYFVSEKKEAHEKIRKDR